jgi:hypothetical protein
VSAKSPSTTNPRWLTDEQAIRRFRSVCAHREQRSVHDAERSEHHEERRRLDGDTREHLDPEAQEPVRAHLQEHAREQHGARGGGLGVRVREPGVEGEDRDLDREGQREGREDPALGRGVERAGTLEQLGHARAARAPHERQHAHEHDEAARDRVEEELQRRVEPVLAAPDADQEVERHEAHLPEEVEEHEIERDEHAQHPGLHHEQPDQELLHALVHVAVGAEHDQRHQQHGQRDQQQRNAVDPDVEADGDRTARTVHGEPRQRDLLLERHRRSVEARVEPEAEERGDQRHEQRDAAQQRGVLRRQQRDRARPRAAGR